MTFRLPSQLRSVGLCALLVLQTPGELAAMEERHDMASMAAKPGHASATHGDHNPAHGGFVLMHRELHFEVVAKRAGGLELYMSDAMRVELPALAVSDVTIEVERAGAGNESVPMTLSEAGDFWHGPSRPLRLEDNTTVHLAFVANNEALVYALPLAALQQIPEQAPEQVPEDAPEPTPTEGSTAPSIDTDVD